MSNKEQHSPDIDYEALLPSISNGTNLDPESWARAKAVLIGMDPRGVSLTRAAQAAGLTRAQLDKQIRDIRDHPENYPGWAREIPVVVDSRFQDQADVLGDALWDRGLNGTEKGVYHNGRLINTEVQYDNRLAMDMLARRDAAYRKGGAGEEEKETTVAMTPEEMFELMRNAVLVKQAQDSYLQQADEAGLLPPGLTIEGNARLVDEDEPAEIPASATFNNVDPDDDDFEDLDL